MPTSLPLTPLPPTELRAALADLPDWRLQLHALTTAFVAESPGAALALVTAIGAAAEDADHHPDVDWRYRHVFVRSATHAAGHRVTARDTALAARVSALATELGLRAEPALAREYEIGVDAADHAALLGTWAAALGYVAGRGGDDVVDPFRRGPSVWFQATRTPAASRLHLDVHVAPEVQGETLAGVDAAGGRTVGAAPSFVVVADADGNRLCVCIPHDDRL